MLNRTQQILIAIVAVAVLGMLWFAGNDRRDDVGGAAPEAQADAQADVQAAASEVRGVPRNGTLDPVSIDPQRPADRLPQLQADALLNAYRDNPAQADRRYLNQYLIVEGVASGIRRDGEQVFVDIRTNDPGANVRALLLPRQICGPAGRECEVEARATMVRRGQKVAVECNGAGLADGMPLLRDCLLRGGAN
ncbi:putative nucleic acid binding protein [Cupriavidus alkaliphilus]|uniref:OB-fold putative lipoprotein n=1 Tax=Cupriavidus alkaliphilus TaxID=942866 RepID=UPI000DE74D74|nr:OB-fold putative lipoprotein [Cupriavidus alkaliphilus]PVY76099.1 putative nucleic acid binding protein [Cupriavidus alkaliphilus]